MTEQRHCGLSQGDSPKPQVVGAQRLSTGCAAAWQQAGLSLQQEDSTLQQTAAGSAAVPFTEQQPQHGMAAEGTIIPTAASAARTKRVIDGRLNTGAPSEIQFAAA